MVEWYQKVVEKNLGKKKPIFQNLYQEKTSKTLKKKPWKKLKANV